MKATGTIYLNDKPIGSFTDFKLNLKTKGTKMKRKHIIENLHNKVQELEERIATNNDTITIQSREINHLNNIAKHNTEEFNKMTKHYQNACTFISSVTSNLQISNKG